MMTVSAFAAPAMLAALALLVPVLLAFLVKRCREVLRVPSTLLWRLAGVPAAQNRRFRNLRRLLSLLACLFAVAALVVAAARPHGSDKGETIAFVVVVSASMDAGGRDSPLAQARRFVAGHIAAGGPVDRYAIIAAGATPVRLAGPIAPGPELDEAVEKLHAERGAADVEAAIDLAAALVAGDGFARIVLVGDGGESVGGLISVREVPIGRRTFTPAARDNLGISSFATRPAEGMAEGDERDALVTVATSSDHPRVARVILTAEGHEIVRRRVDVPAAGEAEVRARVLASAQRLVARVEPDDGAKDAIASDDEAVIEGAARVPPRVVLVGADDEGAAASAFFVEKALGAAGIRDIVRAPASLEGVTFGERDLVVALANGPAKKLDVPALYIGTKTGTLPFAIRGDVEGEAARLRSLEAKDPLLRGVALDGITIERASPITAPAGARALVDLDGGTVLVAGGAGASSFVYLGIDPSKSDLVLRVAFPVLVANALHALGGASDIVVADTVARSEITLREAKTETMGAAEEPDPRFRAALRPALLLAFLGAALLALEALAFRKGWSV
jgi:hypothetical protein